MSGKPAAEITVPVHRLRDRHACGHDAPEATPDEKIDAEDFVAWVLVQMGG